MDRVPELVPISELRTRQAHILEQLKQGPIVLTHRSKAAAVFVDPGQWNRLLEQLEDLQDVIAIQQQELEEERGEAELIPVDEEELRDWAGETV